MTLAPNTIEKMRRLRVEGVDTAAISRRCRVSAASVRKYAPAALRAEVMTCRLRQAAAEGATRAAAAEALGLNYQQARRLAAQGGVSFLHGSAMRDDPRSALMAEMYSGGLTLQQIGDRYGLTRERVRQILKEREAMTGADSGRRRKTAEKRERRRNLRAVRAETRCLASFGASRAELAAIRAADSRAIRAFQFQEKNAHARGIGWELTLVEWWAIWQESGRWAQRGRGQGYVMCRRGDEGPYAVGNVFIATARENSSEQRRKRSGMPMGVRRVEKGGHVAFVARRAFNGVIFHLGTFSTADAASVAYLSFTPPSQVAA